MNTDNDKTILNDTHKKKKEKKKTNYVPIDVCNFTRFT